MMASARPYRTALAVFALFAVYAVVRYHVFKGEPWKRFPLWTLNKVAAMTSVTLFAMALVHGVRRRYAGAVASAAVLGRLGFSLALGHTIASLLLLGPREYPKFFEADGGATLSTSAALAAGLCAFLFFRQLGLGSGESQQPGTRRGWVRLALLGTLVHCAGLGWYVWLEPSAWPAGLLPLTLIGAAIALGGCLASYPSRAPAKADAAATSVGAGKAG
jgi:DMSO/TMAO reductase YedYZ heme-binding membrane subunit